MFVPFVTLLLLQYYIYILLNFLNKILPCKKKKKQTTYNTQTTPQTLTQTPYHSQYITSKQHSL